MKLNRLLFKTTDSKENEKHCITFKITRFGWVYFFTIGFFTAIWEYVKSKI